ncbi:MAG: hypothetical protein GXO08_05595 [Aquificae bacterium]|nr:hypothetical protein [Aquificota bacterium]
MEVKVLRFYPFPLRVKNATVLGYADVSLDDKLEIRGIKLLKKDNGGVFITPPSVQTKEGDFIEVVKFLDREVREEIRKALKEYYAKHFGEI